MEKAWAWATGSTPFDYEAHELLSEERKGAPDITFDQAYAAALAAAEPGSRIVAGYLPASVEDDPTATFSFWLQHGYDPYAESFYPGDIAINVDRHDASRTMVTSGPGVMDTSQYIWGFWNFPTHAGNVVNGWWRLVWFVAGMVPLLLMVSGLSTWFYKRGTRKRRRRLERERAAAGLAPVVAVPEPALAELRVVDPPPA